jgi:hypothetical protein
VQAKEEEAEEEAEDEAAAEEGRVPSPPAFLQTQAERTAAPAPAAAGE